ncbi:hypothetical protein T484DRAFT_1788819 [Baffinella frigidus]|nr:hypothetical protein T484DRAFT_1788819 [Cryptophyta sp. CCMP2293]
MVDELNFAQDALAAVAAEIRASENSSPMRVLFMVASPSVASLLITVILGIVVFEFRDLANLPFLD